MSPAFLPHRLLAAAIVPLLAIGQAQAAPGDLDLGFGAGTGMVRDAMGLAGGQAQAVAIEPGGRIVVAGSAMASASEGDFGVLRLNADGSFDAGFGSGGRSIHDGPDGSDDEAYGLVLQGDSSMVVGGVSFDFDTANDFSALRLNENGSIDPAFGNHGNGWMTSARAGGDASLALAIAADGSFLLGGHVDSASLLDAAAQRLDTLGMPDPLYGNNGFAVVASDSNTFTAVDVQPDGKAVFGGQLDNNGGAILMRLEADGSVDTGFGGDGRLELAAVLTRIADLRVLADGRILVVGHFLADLRVLCLNADGSTDAGFGVNGALTVSAASLGQSQLLAGALALDSAARVIVAGSAIGASGSQLLVLRSSPDGQLDPGFGSGGTRLLDASGDLSGNAVAVQADGAIVIAGSDSDPGSGSGQYLIVRLEGGGGGGPQPPVLSIGDASLIEGDSGSALMTFSVILSAPSAGGVSVDIGTDLGSATPGLDYTPTTAVAVDFPNGVSSVSFQVPVLGDTDVEGDETVLVRLSNPVGATLGDAEATGTVVDDDAVSPPPPTAAAQPVPGPAPIALVALGLLLFGAAFTGRRAFGK